MSESDSANSNRAATAYFDHLRQIRSKFENIGPHGLVGISEVVRTANKSESGPTSGADLRETQFNVLGS